MAAAAFLISDAHMPAKNVTVYEMLDSTGGSLDAPSDRGDGYYRNSGSRHEGRMQTGRRMAHAGSRLKPPTILESIAWKASLSAVVGKTRRTE